MRFYVYLMLDRHLLLDCYQERLKETVSQSLDFSKPCFYKQLFQCGDFYTIIFSTTAAQRGTLIIRFLSGGSAAQPV